MPELPEVETIRRDLEPLIVGRTVRSAWVSENARRLVQLIPPQAFCAQLEGQRIERLSRRGKYLILNLESGLIWVVHLRMTGRFQHSVVRCPESPYLRARFELNDESHLCFADLRKFGMMWLVDDFSVVNAEIGPEPLEESFDLKGFTVALKRRSAPIKAVLLDQTVLAGVGNIYADEALFTAGIRPTKPASALAKPAVARLHRGIRDVLLIALGDRGSSFSDYVDASGQQGAHQLNVKVFRRTGGPCYACGSEIRRIKVGGRSTHYCPRCQK
jgi:formamidopyrimidine-DNA glycosylase